MPQEQCSAIARHIILFKEGRIAQEDVQRLDKAFTFTLRALSLVDRDDPICEIVARKVIEIDAAVLTIQKRSRNWQADS
jgi:hypothetical protein